MSKGVNKAILLGHVGKDPEIRLQMAGPSLPHSHSPPPTARRTARETGRTGRSGTTSSLSTAPPRSFATM